MSEIKRRNHSRRRSGRYHKKGHVTQQWPVKPVGLLIMNFSACASCGYFLTGYRTMILGKDNLNQLSQLLQDGDQDKWLTLAWHPNISLLLQRVYGLHLDSVDHHFSYCCETCHRAIEIHYDNAIPHTFQIEKMPNS